MINAFKLYKPLRSDSAAFRALKLVDGGEILAWRDGKIDMAATGVERLARSQGCGDVP